MSFKENMRRILPYTSLSILFRNLSTCQGDSMCKNMIHHSCSICSKKVCDSCWEQHSCDNKLSTSVIFDNRSDTFQAICTEHNSYVKEVCFDCENKFICIYCSCRSHKTHTRDTIVNQAASTRELLSAQLNKTKKDTAISNITYANEVKKFPKFRELLDIELNERILKKLNRDAVSLNKEKENILLQFDTSVEHYTTELNYYDLIENDFDKAFTLFINKVINNKKDFEILSEMNEIKHQSETFASAHCCEINLKNDDDIKENPLGLLEINSFKEIPENNEVITFLCDKVYYDALRKLEDLSYLIKCHTGNSLFNLFPVIRV